MTVLLNGEESTSILGADDRLPCRGKDYESFFILAPSLWEQCLDIFDRGHCTQISVVGSYRVLKCFSMGTKAPSPSVSGADDRLPSGGKSQHDLSDLAPSIWEQFLNVFSIGGGIHVYMMDSWYPYLHE